MANIYQLGLGRFVIKSNKFLNPKCVGIISTCNISGKEMRVAYPIERLPPYDYKKKGYSFFRALFDHTTKRFNDNSKVFLKWLESIFINCCIENITGF